MTDEVDAIARAWQAQRPDLELAPIQVLSRVSRIAQLLDERRSQAFAEHGLAAHEFDVLAALRRSGAPYEQTPGQLIEATHVTSGTMTNRLDRLAEPPAGGAQGPSGRRSAGDHPADRCRPAPGGCGVRGAAGRRGELLAGLSGRASGPVWPPACAGCSASAKLSGTARR